MDIYIDPYGNASITEIWNAYLSQGTEGYRPFTNLENSTITNFSVSDETGTLYENVSNWNPNLSFANKAYKNGLRSIPNGVELCWGISNYGDKTFTLKYNISNFVNQYTDTQGIYFNFLNLDQSVSNAKVTLHADFPFSLENARIWAFGNDGTIEFENGAIVLNSQGYLSSSQYMVGLVRMESNVFSTTNNSSKSFDEVFDSAHEGVTDYEEGEDENKSSFSFFAFLITLFLFPLQILLNPIIWIFVILFIGRKKTNIKNKYGYSGMLEFGPNGKTLPPDEEIPYFREVPCVKDLARAYWVAFHYHVVSVDVLRPGIIGAILLKWLKENKIKITETKKGLFSFKDNNYAIDLTNIQYSVEKIENDLLEILKSAAGSNEILEAKEFEKWCKKNYYKVDNWFSSILQQEQIELENQQLITTIQKESVNIWGKPKTISVKQVNPSLLNEAIELKGFKKFLLDFSAMPEREYFEVHLWEEYLIFAQLLGIADKVEEQFSKLYPKFNEVSSLDIEFTTIAIRNMATIGMNGVSAGKRSASSSSHNYSGSSRNSGGGGSSHSSGGHSSGGSSGGGFR